jgi:uncharacterized 2Fe-2S/4Fe-4S cluster protein (DUF4445 family)
MLGYMYRLTVNGGKNCQSKENETVLEALTRCGISLSAPCGGRGICGKCRVILREGTVRLTQGVNDPKPGEFFPACEGIPLSDISIELPEGESPGQESSESSLKKRKILRAGVGIDIGTTTVLAQLVDLDSGESVETLSAFNAQRSFGADVMSRINAAMNGKNQQLYSAINTQIEGMLLSFINTWNLSCIEQCTVSGNTTMLHIFTGEDPSSLGVVPFTPVFLEERHFKGEELSLSAQQIITLPGISAFVGADIVSGLAFLDIANRNEDALLVDIGTNGEMALWRKAQRRFLCCSTAAGPCFEGAEISNGMGALPGAINRISVDNGRLRYTTLGNVPPKGICGAALIDAIAVMKRLNAIDETGALANDYSQTGFPLAQGIAITQKDVRQFQLAKSAILSGINVLCKRAGLGPGDPDVFIAGGLGFYIDPENAVTSGLLPPEFAARPTGKNQTAICGNTSLNGAVKCLIDKNFLPCCREIVARSDMAELASSSDFAEAFAENMYF